MAPSSSSSGAAATSVQVALRIRPPTQQDSTSIPARFQRPVIHAASSTSVNVEGDSSGVSGSGASARASTGSGGANKKQVFTFDQVHGPSTTQHSMFTTTAQPLISRFIEGFNCTILAYGQTSSGKTFTMTGIDLDRDPTDTTNGMGIIPRAVHTIFSQARQVKEERAGTWNYSLKGSFIEIYNEDLIDLLSLDAGGRREVQIREDKDGHIIWSGLREVNVKNSGEVMNLIRKGAAIRRTNETDMNAQSSRSHAIFSLTLTQKKYTGSGGPPRSSSPLPPNGRSPSRLARPGSVYTGAATTSRVGSPTFGRPSTPSFASAMGRGGGRPASSLGHSTSNSLAAPSGDESGDWVTIVSKFHFVDLAGSERLKRTAAAGERIKEGISINGGLLALGNVISALGDPSRAKSHTASYVPYRDSKLTRLLQDSLGGNAHTLMIACVSPAEYNVGETVNTLKYANRARNIKNRAVVNEKEEGWDDLEWLQGTVTRLRKELKGIKDGSGVGPSAISGSSAPTTEVIEGAGKKVLAQMSELQNNYEDLREKYVERTEELTRLRRELGESHRSSTGTTTGTAKYEEIVGPVIEEYEKTIATMEAELSLNRAALRHTNEMVEEKEEELAVISERHSASELYVEELRSRCSKLSEREASTEAYIRDLEEKLKTHDESSLTSSESMTDLKKEVAKFRESESSSSRYIAELEARLSRSDESILSLQQTVEKLERESDTRRDLAESLQRRLDTLQQDGDNWRSDLEERETRVRELEEKMIQWELKKQEAGETRTRLGNVVDEVSKARRSLDVEMASKSTKINGNDHSPDDLERSPSEAPTTPTPVTNGAEDVDSTVPEQDETFQQQYFALQQTHNATLADLSSVSSKYRDALREISDLAAQIQEAKLAGQNEPGTDSPATDKSSELPELPSQPMMRRRMASNGRLRETAAAEPQYNAAGRRLFFRQAASAESLHSRSLSQSQSLSQELSSVHSRKTSFSSYGTSSSHSRSSSSNTASASATLNSRPSLSIIVPAGATTPGGNERSVPSLEKEIMRLQEVLKDRENEIQALEVTLKESQMNGNVSVPENGVVSPVEEEAAESNTPVNLSPKTIGQFKRIRQSMEIKTGQVNLENGHVKHDSTDSADSTDKAGSATSESDESLERLNELMLSMAQKESQHREAVDGLESELTQVRRQLEDLTTLNRDQAMNMSSELEALRGRHTLDLQRLQDAQKHEAELVETIERVEAEHAKGVELLRLEHVEAIRAKETEVQALVDQLKQDSDGSLASLREDLAVASASLATAQQEHETAFGKLKADHEEEMQRRLQEAREALEEQHQKAIAEHQEGARAKAAESAAALQQTEEDYYNVLTKLRADHAAVMEKQASDAAATLERIKEQHASDLRAAELAGEGSLTASESSRDAALQSLRDEHMSSISRKEVAHTEELEALKSEHSRILATKEDDFNIRLGKMQSEHNGVLAKMKEEWRVESEKLISAREALEKDSASAAKKAKLDLDAALQDLKVQNATFLEDVGKSHADEIEALKSTHLDAVTTLKDQSQEEMNVLAKTHTEETLKLKTGHQEAIAALEQQIIALQTDHTSALDELRVRGEQALNEETTHLQSTLKDLQQQHADELATLHKDYDLIKEELESHKAAAKEYELLRQQSQDSHNQALESKDETIDGMEKKLTSVESERDTLVSEMSELKRELERTRNEQTMLVQEASKRESLTMELDRHRSVLAEMQDNLQKVKDEKDVLQVEKGKSDQLLKELQAQLSRSSSPPNNRLTGVSSYQRPTPGIKLPPPTPPPSVPPPPAPREANHSMSSQASTASTRDSQLDSPATSVGTPVTGVLDNKVAVRMDQLTKQCDEQETMIKTLNKQLTHCESDLQTHMDLVSTLETSLGDSEKNLRKARMHATEIARERDTLSAKTQQLQTELTEARREVVNVRQSIVEEKQSLEQRLDDERRQKERARQQLESRTEEMTKRKSKFACI